MPGGLQQAAQFVKGPPILVDSLQDGIELFRQWEESVVTITRFLFEAFVDRRVRETRGKVGFE